MSDLFGEADALPEAAGRVPLAERLRPTRLADVIGQDHLTGPDGAITRMLAAGHLGSLVLWGPPGTGKTTIARLLADAAGLRYASLSAVLSGVADLKRVFAEAEASARRTLLFVDEIHRFNRSQQDGFLPFVERGTVVMVAATTENPSFSLNAALLSRASVLVLHRLNDDTLDGLLGRAEMTVGRQLPLTAEARLALIAAADGDGRFLLNQAEVLLAAQSDEQLDVAALRERLQRRMPVYDRDRDGHYGLISALHKAMRGSDPHASLYYLARMLTAGEDPHYVLRRIMRFASEDIGLADPQALARCGAAKEAYDFLGSPEGELAIVQACLYCATAPKSNAAYLAQKAAWAFATEHGSAPPPPHILPGSTKLMRDLGQGAGYVYDHDAPDAFAGQSFWPDDVPATLLYQPNDRGFEKRVQERLAFWDRLRRER